MKLIHSQLVLPVQIIKPVKLKNDKAAVAAGIKKWTMENNAKVRAKKEINKMVPT